MSEFEQQKRIAHEVLSNPDKPCPPEILRRIVGVEVVFVDVEGNDQRGIIEVHETLTHDVADFFALARSIDFPISSVTPASAEQFGFDDGKLMAANASSGFNYRTIAGTDRPSLHGLGRAIDVNPRLNPYLKYDEQGSLVETHPADGAYDTRVAGTFTAGHPLVRFMKERGWEWGGDWTPETGRTDLHHFQKAA
jgi:hypothetical protein